MSKDYISWTKKLKTEVRAIRKYLFPLISKGFFASIVPWLMIFVLALIANFIAIIITYFRGQSVELGNFFPPNSGWGLIIILFVMFIYQLTAVVAIELSRLRVHADKYSWNDVDIDIFHFPPDSLHGLGIALINNKPFLMKNVFVHIVYLQQDNRPRIYSSGILPHPLPWIHGEQGRAYYWGKYEINPNGGKQIVGLFNLSSSDTREEIVHYFSIPGGNGQPEDNRGLDSFSEESVVVELEFNGEVENVSLSPIKRRYRARYINNTFETVEI